MNAARLHLVADAIEQGSVIRLGFNMLDTISTYNPDLSQHGCKTTACIAGWANAVRQGISDVDGSLSAFADIDEASEWLELSQRYTLINQGDASLPIDLYSLDLFMGHPTDVLFTEVTPAQAVATLRYAATYDVIDWDAATATL